MSLPAASPRKVRLGDLEIDLETAEVRRNGDRFILQGQPFQILAVLLERPGELVTREDLKGRLWASHTFVDFDHSLNKAVNRLREALGDSADAPTYIETIPRRGYRFIGPLEHPAPPRLIGFPERTAERKEEQVTPEPTQGSAIRFWRIAVVGTLLLLVALGLAFFQYYRRPASSLPSSAFQVVPLTTLPGEEVSPTFSPDGSQVAFGWNGENRGAGFDLYVKVIGTDKPLRLTHHPAPVLSAVWSPDGRSIAFRRVDVDSKNAGIFLVSALGGPERKLASINDQLISRAEISWSPDGARLAFADHADSTDVLSTELFVLSLDTLQRKRVESGCSHVYDTAFGPTGQMLAYACGLDVGQSSLNLIELATSRRRQLFVGPWIGGLTWCRDGERIVFSAASSGDLWQVRVTGKAFADKISAVHDSVSPTINSRGDRLAYVEFRSNINAWRVDLGGKKVYSNALAPSTRQQFQPVISPDGKKVAFVSNRSGTFNIWVCDADGGNLQELTSFADAGAGSPQWSPDGKHIAFDSRSAGEPNVYVVDANGGIPRKLATGTRLNSLPSWSHDGRWIYFASGPDIANLNIWRVPSTGGNASQLTNTPSLKPIESPDGQYLYFARHTSDKVRLWRAQVDGSDEKMLEAIPPLSDAHQWWPSVSGVYFWADRKGKPEVDFLDLRTSQIRRIYVPENLPTRKLAGLSVSPDAKWLVYSRVDELFQDLMLVNNFH